MAETKEGLLHHYREARKEMLAAIHGLSDAQLSEPMIDDWSVKDHLGHLSLWDDVRATEVARISAGHNTAWKMTPEQDAAYSLMGYQLRKNLSAAQIRYEFEMSRKRLLKAIESITPRGLDASLYGECPVRSGHETEHMGWIKRWRGEKATSRQGRALDP